MSRTERDLGAERYDDEPPSSVLDDDAFEPEADPVQGPPGGVAAPEEVGGESVSAGADEGLLGEAEGDGEARVHHVTGREVRGGEFAAAEALAAHDPHLVPAEHESFLPVPADGPTLGPRQARLVSERRRRRATTVALLSALAVLLAAVLVLPQLTRGQGQPTSAAVREQPPRETEPALGLPASGAAADPTPLTVLLVGYGEEGGPARSTTLLSAAGDGSSGAVVFMPPGLLLELPGFGLDRLGQAHRYKGPALVEETLEENLEVEVDDHVALSEAGLATLLDRVGEFDVYVGEAPLVAREEEGVAPVRIEPGQQQLDGEQMALYFDLLAEGESPLDAFPRQQQVLAALLAQIAADPEALDRVFAEGATEFAGSSNPEALRRVLEALAQAQSSEQLTYEVLPVEPFGGPREGTPTTYRPAADSAAFLASVLPGEE